MLFSLPHLPKSRKETQVTCNLNYYLVFKDVRKILKELHLFLTPDQAHNVFSELFVLKTPRVLTIT